MGGTRMRHTALILVLGALGVAPPPAEAARAGATPSTVKIYSAERGGYVVKNKVVKSNEEWRRELTPEQYRVTREQGTERAFTGAYWNTKDKGVYRCVACGTDLFRSDEKFDSGTGWPSFWAPVAKENVDWAKSGSPFLGTEVHCSRCGAHLGHVFDDGPKPTGLRYCINSVALKLEKSK